MGRAAEALADFDRALALRPNNPEDHCNRAGALADLGRIDEALAGFTRAIALMPAMAPAYYNRADVLMRIGRPAEALARLRPGDRALSGDGGGARPARRWRSKALGRPRSKPRASFKRGRRELDPKFAATSASKH